VRPLGQGSREMKTKGKISSWNEGKGFGFITPNEGGKQIFVHIKAFNNRKKIPAINQVVTFTLSTDKQGRPCAEKVTRAGEVLSKKTKKGNRSFALFVPVIFAVFVGVSASTNNIEFLIFPFYLVISLFTFILYAIDKSAAKKGSWRTQESTLHLFSLAGGWPGAMIAQKTLRHKSIKQPFRAVFWVTVMLNTGVLFWLHTSEGGAVLSSILKSEVFIPIRVFAESLH